MLKLNSDGVAARRRNTTRYEWHEEQQRAGKALLMEMVGEQLARDVTELRKEKEEFIERMQERAR